MNRMQVDNKKASRQQVVLLGLYGWKNQVNTLFMDPWDMTLLCIIIWTLGRRSTISTVGSQKCQMQKV